MGVRAYKAVDPTLEELLSASLYLLSIHPRETEEIELEGTACTSQVVVCLIIHIEVSLWMCEHRDGSRHND